LFDTIHDMVLKLEHFGK